MIQREQYTPVRQLGASRESRRQVDARPRQGIAPLPEKVCKHLPTQRICASGQLRRPDGNWYGWKHCEAHHRRERRTRLCFEQAVRRSDGG